jgi:hypothetical protein
VAAGDVSRDRVFFRRLLLAVHVNEIADWIGEIQFDAASSILGDRLTVRDAYLRYIGFANRGLTVTIGNQKMPFSRSALAPSTRRGLIERSATGERPFGAPGRAIAVQVEGRHHSQRIQWATALASALHAPDVFEIRIDGLPDARDTWNEGVLAAGRIEWHPLGPTPRDQGDLLRSPIRVVTGASLYRWQNDGDRNLFTADGVSTSPVFADADRANGVELSAGFRGRGLSVDAAWQRVSARTIDPTFAGGLYRGGAALLHSSGVEAGYMLLPSRLELLGGIDTVKIAAREAVAYRPTLGATWYVRQHRLKFQFTHRETFNALGARGVRTRATILQAQIAF